MSNHETGSGTGSFFAGLDRFFRKFEIFVLTWGVILMAANTIANVFGRYVFSQSLYFSEELNQFLIIIITFIGLGFATREGRHIRMSAIYDMLSPRKQKILMILIAALTAVVMFILAWYALEYVQKVASRGRITPALQLPLYLTYVWVVIGLTLTSFQYLLTTLRNLNFAEEEIYVSYLEVDSYEDPETAAAVQRYVDADAETKGGEDKP